MADLFISYSRADRPRCSEIRDALAALKVDVWFDVGIEPGHSFDREIERELGAAKAVLVLWSETSVGSDWVRNEARTGKESDRLAALQIGPCQLPLEFRSIQAEPLPADQPVAASPAWPAMLRRLGDLVGRPGLSDYARLAAEADTRPDAWRRWIAANPADPLVADAVERMIEGAAPDLKGQLASERARRAALEAQLAEHVETDRAQAG
ncbi:MAG TPA: toll/interleukin-1 receptor domain-containing protein, partial [Allosphingosinicella sp.]|nr:toll/interleukin-1 receptor domain-containing protein [Allosphingosinicella sp.]